MLKTYPFSKQKIIFSKIHFFSQLLSSGIVLTIIQKLESLSVFKNNIIKFIRPTSNSAFNCENHRGIKLISRLAQMFSSKFCEVFKNTFSFRTPTVAASN